MKKLSLQDLSLAGKQVLMRVDFNVPMKEGVITDDARIKACIPSIEYILNAGASLILMSHLGRPEGKIDPQFSLKPLVPLLSKLLNKEVKFAPDCIGPATEKLASTLKPGEILLLENLRFHKEEEKGDPAFAKQLASLGNTYVNDAFATAHRKHASTAVIAESFPNAAATGFLMEKEIAFLSPLALNPKRPFHALIGGAKISTKCGVLAALIEKVDALFLGGGMIFTFFKAQGLGIGSSIVDMENLDTARAVIKRCQEKAIQLYLPKEVVITNDTDVKIVSVNNIPEGWKGVDIAPSTIEDWTAPLKNAQTIFWNGPMGIFEDPRFAKGTEALAKLLSESKATTVVGGGDSVAAITQAGFSKNFSHVSTGGGASLEFLELGYLPGIEALSNR
ncbi:MAG: phosphoglycerate kinase [Simkaniaceae bacterium]|nr:phosphoglycerate kinase [Simkaniaceae bacterium]